MSKFSKLIAAATLALTAGLAGTQASAWWGDGYYGGPWGYPGYWGGYPGWGGWGYPYGGWGYPYGGWGYPGWGGWGHPGWGGWGYPYAAPYYGAQQAQQPQSSSGSK